MKKKKTFKDLRVKKGYTQESLAQALGVSHKSVCRWEHGDEPKLKQYFKLRELLGNEIDDIFKEPN